MSEPSLALPAAQFLVGIDWAAEVQAVCMMNADGRIVSEFTIAHCADGIALLVRRLAKLGAPGGAMDIPVGIERPNGRLVDLLLEAGHPVVPVSPNAIKTWREGEVLSGAKSDCRRRRGDRGVPAAAPAPAEDRGPVLGCDQGRADRGAQPRRPGRDAGRRSQPADRAAGRALAGREGDHRRPGVPDRLEFLTLYPTLAAAAHLGEKRRAAFCASHGYSGTRLAAELLGRLRSAPAGTTDSALAPALRDAVLALVSVVKALNAAIKDLDRPLAARLGEQPDGEIFTSLPRSG